MLFFLFKQKTAYEVRISDWSSDVCSSDLELLQQGAERGELLVGVGVVALDHGQGGHGLAGHRVAFALLPIAYLERLRQLRRRVVQRGCEHEVLLDAQAADGLLREALGDAAEDVTVELGREHVCTPVTNAQLVCRLLLEKKTSS